MPARDRRLMAMLGQVTFVTTLSSVVRSRSCANALLEDALQLGYGQVAELLPRKAVKTFSMRVAMTIAVVKVVVTARLCYALIRRVVVMRKMTARVNIATTYQNLDSSMAKRVVVLFCRVISSRKVLERADGLSIRSVASNV